jgi:hypothetical protein
MIPGNPIPGNAIARPKAKKKQLQKRTKAVAVMGPSKKLVSQLWQGHVTLGLITSKRLKCPTSQAEGSAHAS